MRSPTPGPTGRRRSWRWRASWAVVALAALGCGQEAARFPAGTPVVLVSIDTLRSDRLPAYGYEGVATPAIDRLAADSVLFEHAYTHVPLTLPSHASVMTGLLPAGHGVRDNLGYRLEAAAHPSLTRSLREAGYATGAAVSAFVLRSATGLAYGFDFYEDRIQIRTGAALGSLQRPGDETLEAARVWLADAADRPFLFFFHIYEPHSPYEPPEPFASRYASRYDGEVAAADAVIGRLLAELDRLGVYDRALVVLFSDHGEGLGDHGEQEHEILLYREVVQVPLLVKLPHGERAGTRVDSPVQLSDLMPTVLDGLGLPIPEGLDGRSMLPLIDGETLPRRVYSESFYPRLHFGWSELTSLIDGRYHYIEGPDPELYDLATDPSETRNVLRDERRIYRTLRDELATYDTRLVAPADVDPETRDRLAALGYVGSFAGDEDGPRPDPKSRLGVLAELKQAFVLYSQGEMQRAAEAFAAVVEREPGMVDAWEHLGRAQQRLGRVAEARATFERALELSGGAPHVALALAEVLLQAGELEAAREHAELALPAHEVAYDLLAEIAFAEGDLVEAERRIAEALPSRGTRIGPLLLQARLALERGEAEAAIEATRRAETEFGNRPDREALARAFLVRGQAHAALGQVDEAEGAFRAGLLAAPAELDLYTHLAYLYAVAGRGPEAGSVLRAMVTANDRPEAYAAAVKALGAMGDERSAAAVLRQALDRWPRSQALRELASAPS